MSGDPYFNSVSLLLSMDGANGSTTFTDSSSVSKIVTANGNAQISTVQSKFGGASGYLDGSGDYLLSSSSEYNIAQSDFTVEAWIYQDQNSTLGNTRTVFHFNAGSSQGLHIHRNDNGYLVVDNGVVATTQGNITVPLNTWTHIAVVRNNNVIKGYVNGMECLSHAAQTYATATQVLIGQYSTGATVSNFKGYIDDLRITKGVARYTSNFSVPTTAFPATLPPTFGGDSYYNQVSLLMHNNSNDPYYDNTSLILDMNGTDGSTTFTDKSQNALVVTANGNAQISTTQSKFGGASAYFDGSGDYLRIPDNNLFTFDADFTIEAWVNIPNVSGARGIASHWYSGVATNCSWLLQVSTSQTLAFSWGIGGTNSGITSTSTVPLNQWVHVSVTRQGSTVRLFIDGVLDATTATVSGALNNCPDGLGIGCVSVDRGITNFFLGYIDDLRITKGVARYTSNFTPVGPNPTGYDFVDNSNNAFTITQNGNARLSTTQSKFGGASAYFDNSGSYLSLPNNASFAFGTGDFTIESWLYMPATQSLYDMIICQDSTSTNAWYVSFDGSGKLRFTTYATVLLTSGEAIPTNIWVHVAITRVGTTLAMYVDGVLSSSVSNSTNFDVSSGSISIGKQATYYYYGHIDDLRITKGVARYTSNFSVPPREFSDNLPSRPGDIYYDKVSLLLNMNGTNGSTTFTDSSPSPKTVTANGNAQISTTQSKFGGASAYFDGTGDYLYYASNSAFGFGTGDFTIEAWVKTSSSAGGVILDTRTTGSEAATFYINPTTGVLGFFISSSQLGTISVIDGNWHHIAWCRASGTMRMFVDGVQNYSATVTDDFGSSRPAWIATQFGGSLAQLNGYIDDLRITKGIARYTSNFSVPDSEFLNYKGRVIGYVKDSSGFGALRTLRAYDRNTGALVGSTMSNQSVNIPGDDYYNNVSLLLHMNGTNGSTTFTDHSPSPKTVTAYGNAQISTAQSKFGGASALFDGTEDYVYGSLGSDALGAGDFTIELWFYRVGNAINQNLFVTGTGVTATSFTLYVNTLNQVVWYANGGVRITTSAIAANAFVNIAVVRASGTTKVYIDGANQGAAYTDANNYSTADFSVGFTSSTINGHIDDLRITKGVARYTANFTPPSVEFYSLASQKATQGGYLLPVPTLDEVDVVCLDDAAGTVQQDKILRTFPM